MVSTGQGVLGCNMFAYCENDPVGRTDSGGKFWSLVIGGVIGAIVGGISAAISSYKTTGEVNIASVIIGATAGCIGGVISASGIPAAGQAVASGIISAGSNLSNKAFVEGKKIDKYALLATLQNFGI